jgi:hypothetical protein
LCGGVVGTQRLEGVADELEADRVLGAGWKKIDDAAANAKLAGLVDRILPGVAGGSEQVAQIRRRDLHAFTDRQRGRLNVLRRADARQQGCGRRHDNPGSALSEGVQRSRPRRCDFEVRGETAIRVHFVRGEGKDCVLDVRVGQPFGRGKEEARVCCRALDVGIGRHDQQHAIAGRRSRNEHRLRGRRQARDPLRRHTHACSAECLFQQRPKSE